MSFLEAFFSTEKIFIPITFGFILGILFSLLASFSGINITDVELEITFGIGFIIGNIIKSNKIIDIERLTEESKRRKKK